MESTKVGFSKFCGTGLIEWLEDCEYYFDLFQTPEMYKTRMTIPYFTGDAREWYRFFKLDNPHPPW